MVFNKFIIACDHGGYPLKNLILQKFSHLPWVDLGVNSEESVDYPDYAKKLTAAVQDENTCGVLICGSGQGMAIQANRAPHIRAALCWSEEVTRLSRQHNNANVICMGSRTTDHDLALKMFDIFINTPFEGGRHAGRVKKLSC